MQRTMFGDPILGHFGNVDRRSGTGEDRVVIGMVEGLRK